MPQDTPGRAHKWVSVAIPFIAVMLTSSLRGESFLVENGQPRAEIILAEKPARAARLGASELQTYVEKISGATLAIVSIPILFFSTSLRRGWIL